MKMRRKYQRSFFFVAGSAYAIICVFEVFRYWKATSTPMTSSSSQTKSDIMSERGNENFNLMAKSLLESLINPEMKTEEGNKNLSNNNNYFIEKSCSPEKNPKILFVKTFKTGSTTIQNILFRHGLSSQSTFVLPHAQTSFSSDGESDKIEELHKNIIHLSDGSLLQPLQVEWLKEIPWHIPILESKGHYDILAVHHVWNEKADNALLGPGKKNRITILRNPSQAYESIFNGFHYDRIVQTTFPDFVQQVYISPSLYRYRFGKLGLGLNQQLAMFGLVGDDAFNPGNVVRTIEKIDLNFDLVMIMEKIDESLVLLADLMCWPLHKVASLLVNGRQIERRYDVSPEEAKKLKTWQWPDEWLYDHFKKKLRKEIKSFGEERMKEKVSELRGLQRSLVTRCVEGQQIDEGRLEERPFRPWSRDVQGYKIKSSQPSCLPYGLTENGFIEILRKKQIEEWDKSIEEDDEEEKEVHSDV